MCIAPERWQVLKYSNESFFLSFFFDLFTDLFPCAWTPSRCPFHPPPLHILLAMISWALWPTLEVLFGFSEVLSILTLLCALVVTTLFFKIPFRAIFCHVLPIAMVLN